MPTVSYTTFSAFTLNQLLSYQKTNYLKNNTQYVYERTVAINEADFVALENVGTVRSGKIFKSQTGSNIYYNSSTNDYEFRNNSNVMVASIDADTGELYLSALTTPTIANAINSNSGMKVSGIMKFDGSIQSGSYNVNTASSNRVSGGVYQVFFSRSFANTNYSIELTFENSSLSATEPFVATIGESAFSEKAVNYFIFRTWYRPSAAFISTNDAVPVHFLCVGLQ